MGNASSEQAIKAIDYLDNNETCITKYYVHHYMKIIELNIAYIWASENRL